ncbi:hypothetical protein HC766_02860 [Candidatus Gracilibacteria bacterium]|nr:hypothetical protein [Candidatus Gracilibacteria bacterium]NJS41299.1 hypothetical protein [Candidatus Gracilibacteria bacterium]
MTLRKTVPVLSLLVIGLFAMLSLLSPKASAIGRPLNPIPECKIVLLQPDITGDGVPDPTGMWRGVWGYWNRNAETIDNVIQPGIEAGGPNNYFNVGHNNSSYNPDQSVANQGQPSAFLPGRYQSVFSTDMPQNTALGWYVSYWGIKAAWINSYSSACPTNKVQMFVDPSEWYLYGI